ncbi:MAG: hypothetical protein LBQ76_04570 [Candidatus Fibromonas sp.]|jgi:uncharacterized protein (TIGR02145 family)|nr:hypothetical protein [Candidatus Fibromonas sp.]
MSKTVSKFILTAGLVLAMALTFSCSLAKDDDGSVSTCSAEFRTVTIGTQIWMAENLNCDVKGSRCYNDDPANCAKYGRLYDWSTTMAFSSNRNPLYNDPPIKTKHRGICPSGWHIPRYEDWMELITTVGGEDAGAKLKTTSDWIAGGNGTDEFDFSALPGGGSYWGGSFENVGLYGNWWSAHEDGGYGGYFQLKSDEESTGGIDWHYDSKSYLFSVRCLQD